MMLAAALVVLAANSCNKDNISDAPAQDSMVVKFTANVAGTKAVFNPSSFEDGAAVPVLWKTGDNLRMYVNEKVLSKLPDLVGVNLPNGAECSESATWTHDFAPTYDPTSENYVGHMPEAPFTFYAFCPGASMRGFYSGEQQRIRINTIPSEQTPEQNTCDPEAMCIYSISETYDVWPEEVEMPEFRHMTAYGCITLGSGIPETAVVEKVKITANEGQYLAGDAWYYYAGEKEGLWEDYKADSRSETITIKTAFKENIWFGCCPTTDLKSLTFEVYTTAGDCYVVEKNVSGKNFEAGKVAKMTVTGFEKVETGGVVTYTFGAASLSTLVGGRFSKSPFTKESLYNDEPSLKWNIRGELASGATECNVTNASGRIKFGTGTKVAESCVITIAPDEGWIVKSVSVNSAVLDGKSYDLVAKVGDKTLISQTIKTKENTDYSGENADLNQGALEISFTNSGESAGVFYISNIVIELTPAE